jgi:hypothetical protein
MPVTVFPIPSRRGARRFALLAVVLAALATQAPVEAAQAGPSIAISGNHFVNGAGQTVRLLGVNHASFEYGCVDGFGYSDGHMDDADAADIASWGATAVRIPLNEDCWLGINGQPNSDEDPDATLTQAGYQQAVESYVSALNAHGLYAILDLHWSAPGAQEPLEQQPMPDYDHSPDFWTSVASAFKNNPGVVFDLFNEPYSPTDPRSGDDTNSADTVTWSCWKSGGASCYTSAYGESGAKTTRYRVAGMQELVNAVRSTGAQQPVLLGGLDYANDLSGWLANKPNDPLNQEAASFHNYQGKSCDNVSCWNSQIAPVAASVPVATGEFDEDNFDQSHCANKTPSTFDQDYMNWSDQHGVSYLAWGWEVLDQATQNEQGCSAYFLTGADGVTPAEPNGTALHDHLLALPSGAGSGGGGAGGAIAPVAIAAPLGPQVTLKLLSAAVKTGDRRVGFKLSSPESSSGTLTGQTSKSYSSGSGKHKHKAPVALGVAHFTLNANRSKTVTLTLSKDARKLLVAKHSLKVQLAITLTSSGYPTTTVNDRLTLKTPAKKPAKKH